MLRRALLVVATAAVALAFAPPGPNAITRRVAIMRHCVRTTHTHVDNIPFSNFSTLPFPGWPYPAYTCLDRGETIIAGEGSHLAALMPKPIYLVADNPSRDVDTALDLTHGLGSTDVYFSEDPSLFDPATWGVCEPLSDDQRGAFVQQQYNALPKPANYDKLMAALQQVLGKGPAGPIASYKDAVVNGSLTGQTEMGHAFTEAFLMQYGGGMQMAWGNLTADQMYALLGLHYYYRQVNSRPLGIMRHEQANLFNRLSKELQGDSNTSVVYVGHDSNLDGAAVLLNMTWTAAPYGFTATPPGSMLIFTATGSMQGGAAVMHNVTAQFAYTTFDQDDGKLTVVPALFAGGAKSIKYADLQAQIAAAIDPACVQPEE